VGLDLSLIGVETSPHVREWSESDAILYALSVGAGLHEQMREGRFMAENSGDGPLQVLPTFGALLGGGAGRRRPIGKFDAASMVHAEQSFEQLAPLPVAGTAVSTSRVTDVFDKGTGALVVTETLTRDVATGGLLGRARSSSFIKGEGGFGGDRGPSSRWVAPENPWDSEVVMDTLPNQAFLLTGDRNPLHINPIVAARGGFRGPILHGMCTYGFAGRALLGCLCGSDPTRFKGMTGRFTSPIFPGQRLHIFIWNHVGEAKFRVETDDGTVVIDQGECWYV
jgi:acyl dehydratase